MELNTHLNRKSGCPLTLHKLQVDPLNRFAEAADFGQSTSNFDRLVPNLTRPCAEAYFERSGFATIAIGAFAPIPEGYELLSVASGVLGLDPRTYLLASLLGRGGR